MNSIVLSFFFFFFSSRRRHTIWNCDWSSDVCSSDLGLVLGVDLEPIAGLPPPVRTWVADAFAPELLERLRAEGGAPYDAVLSDLAPKTSGVRGPDEARSLALAERAVELARQVLKPAGSLVVKVFMGGGFDDFLRAFKQAFGQVKVVKPEASVARGSKEVYLVGQGLKKATARANPSNV